MLNWHRKLSEIVEGAVEKYKPGNSYWREKLSTVDLLALNSPGKMLFILKIFICSFTKQGALTRRSNVLSSPSVSVPWLHGQGYCWTMTLHHRHQRIYIERNMHCQGFHLSLIFGGKSESQPLELIPVRGSTLVIFS